MRSGDVLPTVVIDDNDKNISKNDDPNSDLDESIFETESDDASNDEYIPTKNGSDVLLACPMRKECTRLINQNPWERWCFMVKARTRSVWTFSRHQFIDEKAG